MTPVDPTDRDDRPPAARRVLVSFGAVADEATTVEVALALGRAMSAEIAGHFVEESSLLAFAGLPFAKAIRPTDRRSSSVGHTEMEREIARSAKSWERRLAARARHSHVTFSYRTTRGSFCNEIRKAVSATDIAVINPANVAARWGDALTASLAAIHTAAGAVILPQRGRAAATGPVALLVSDHAPTEETCRLAARIARTIGNSLAVLAAGSDRRTIADAIHRARAAADMDVALFETGPADEPDARAALATLAPSFVVWPRGPRFDEDPMLEPILHAGRAPLLLLRQPDNGNDNA